MQKFFIVAGLCFFHIVAYPESPIAVRPAKLAVCPNLLSNALEVSDAQKEMDHEWLRAHSNFRSPPEIETALQLAQKNLHSWQKINSAQRAIARSTELRALGPSAPRSSQFGKNARGQIIPLNEPDLNEISRTNKDRWLAQIFRERPLTNNTDTEKALVRKMSSDLEVRFLHGQGLGYDALTEPLVSPSELKRRGYEENQNQFSYYGKLLQVDHAVEFKAVVTNQLGFKSVADEMRADRVELDKSFALQSGIVLPLLKDMDSLINFFCRWDPEGIYGVVKANSSIWPGLSQDEFLMLALTGDIKQYVSDESAYSRLAPLRTRLINYVMTTDDFASFIANAFGQFMLRSFTGSEQVLNTEAEVTVEWAQAQYFKKYFVGQFLPWLNHDGFVLRVPISVPTTALSPVHKIPIPNRALLRGMPGQLPDAFDPTRSTSAKPVQ